jgi:hypothetical protein
VIVKSPKEVARRLVSERTRGRVRRLGRVRWITKAQVIRRQRGDWWRAHPFRALAYVACDPEVDTFTYDIENEAELVACLAKVLAAPEHRLRQHLVELRHEPELNELLDREVRWRPAFKRRQRLAAHHLAAWLIIRETEPQVVVETGILDGLGSRTMLAALQLNEHEGARGLLISFDIIPNAGALVPDRLKRNWRPVYESTTTAMDRELQNLSVGFLTHDSDGRAEHQRFEFNTALAHAATPIILMTPRDGEHALAPIVEANDGRYEPFKEQPHDHFFTGRNIGIGIVG